MYMRGKNILLSGGSRGLGLHLVERFLEGGNRVATFARSPTAAMTSLSERYGAAFHFEALDGVDEPRVKAMVRRVCDLFGTIDGLVNNAAIGQDELLVHTPPERIQQILAVNIAAPILLTRLVLKRMLIQEDHGSIVNITSICGSRGYAGLGAYAASKGALEAFTRAIAREVGEAGVRINNVAPGFFASEMSSVLLPEQMDVIRRRTPTGVLSNEQDVFVAVDLLLSRTANIQGQTVTVDGGITI
ncbi:MAG: SDR family oxidoreductase [Beijerinckiaceae bacterium]|jgi:3-oxoacyl-[acyl-carrier protein] reductase|nr:SDR family oxidoreductase [Beijerinckiaceae bacterium]